MTNKPSDQRDPGFYIVKLVKNGPEMPLHIWTVGRIATRGKPGKPPVQWLERHARLGTETADPDNPRWVYAKPCSEKEYRLLLAKREWDQKHHPTSAGANPNQPIDLMRTPLPF